MEVQDLREFIAEKFELHDRILEERFKNVDQKLLSAQFYQKENIESHKELKDSILRLQEDLTKVKIMEVTTKHNYLADREVERYKEEMKSKYSIMRVVEKYPKLVFSTLALLFGLLLTGDLAGILKFLGL